ncbi:pre-rRNA-processing protein las1-like isoform X2 [Diospyros lotus]|uniref:pre-rRNA-processing protein las1-like isoform X2 n=1 Tax=Diospyros lotus TaxID=55363 RepID=UPI00225078FF|nr:pre-rRNA-processing protein las1-like isoform X2 [Diospyros lotus]
MDALLGFNETTSDMVDRSSGYKMVPWLSWVEWEFVQASLFSSCPQSISSAIRRITAWRSRGCLPVAIEVTAALIEVQQKDPYFSELVFVDARVDIGNDGLGSEEMLAMLYCMAIMRLVNGVVEKTRKKMVVSIAEAADAINIPRMLIDIRHEGSHRDLPSLRLVRLASIKALDWLKSYYWEPQQKAIRFQSHATASLRKEIKAAFCQLAFYLKVKQDTGSSSSLAKEKCLKHHEILWGRNKFLSLMTGKTLSSKSGGPRRQVTKALKNLVHLYSSFSSDVVSVLIDLLLKESHAADFAEVPKICQVSEGTDQMQSAFDDWKPIIAKLSNKEPELLMTLLKSVLEIIETEEGKKYGNDSILENIVEVHHIERLSHLVRWLVENLNGLKLTATRRKDSGNAAEGCSADSSRLPKSILVELLRKCLLASWPGNEQLRNSALVLAHMIGNSSLIDKLNKLHCLLAPPTAPMWVDEQNSSISNHQDILAQHRESIRKAEVFNLHQMQQKKSNVVKARDGGVTGWTLAKSWNKCPIGMLPRDIGSSGRLPVLDCCSDEQALSESSRELSEEVEGEATRKRKPDWEIELLKKSSTKKKKRREMELDDAQESDGEDLDAAASSWEGQLMMDGVWKRAGEEELRAIASAVRILV